MSFSERLDELLKARGMTAKQLTQELCIGATAVTDWKRGKSTPSPDILIKISQILNASVDTLLGIEKSAAPDGERPTNADVLEMARDIMGLAPEDRERMADYLSLLKKRDNP